MIDGEELDLPTLLHLHKRLGALICEDMGHDWREIQFDGMSTGPSAFDKCARCGDTRSSPSVGTANTNWSIGFSGKEVSET